MEFDFATPTRIVFGPGRLSSLGVETARLGTRALVVTGRHAMRATGVLDRVCEALRDAGVSPVVADVASPDPTTTDVDDAAARGRAGRCDVVVGLGGGSAIDAAKAAAVGVTAGDVSPLVGTTLADDVPALPIVAVPTTGGSGAEVTKGAIITDLDRNLKSGIRGPQLFPATAVVDPDLLATMPAPVAQETAWDALSHGIESYVARRASRLSRALSETCLGVLADALPRLATTDLDDAVLREELAFGALLGGLVVATASTCLPHRVQQALGSVQGASVSHGRGLAAVYRAWLDHAYPHAPRAFDRVGELLGADDIGLGLAELRTRLGLDLPLTGYGFGPDDLDAVVAKVTGNVDNDPSPDTGPTTVLMLLERSL